MAAGLAGSMTTAVLAGAPLPSLVQEAYPTSHRPRGD
jgi:hypothetical protein